MDPRGAPAAPNARPRARAVRGPRWTAVTDVGPTGVRSSDHVSLAIARPPSADRSLCCFPFREQWPSDLAGTPRR